MNEHIPSPDTPARDLLPPFTLLRPLEDLRIGIHTIREKWEGICGTRPERIPATVIPGDWTAEQAATGEWHKLDHRILSRPWQMHAINAWAIGQDYNRLTRSRHGSPLPECARVTGSGGVFIEEGAVIEHCYINTTDGPVYVGREARILEGAMLRGPLAVCDGAVVKMGAALYGGTTIGPFATVGGEVKNSILMDWSNKSHHGYLGDAVIGQWCNLGAGTSCSNLRNTGHGIDVWNMSEARFEPAGAKCGLLMGDFSRSAIHTAFNTGTVVGVSAHVFGHAGLTPKYIPSFSWGADPAARYRFEKAWDDITVWMSYKGVHPDEGLRTALQELYSER